MKKSNGTNIFPIVLLLVVAAATDTIVGIAVGLIVSASWDAMGSVTFVNTVVFFFSTLGIVGLSIISTLLFLWYGIGRFARARGFSFSPTKKTRILLPLLCIASAGLMAIFIFIGEWNVFIYLKYNVWLSISEAFSLFLRTIDLNAPSSSGTSVFVPVFSMEFWLYSLLPLILIPLLHSYILYFFLVSANRRKEFSLNRFNNILRREPTQ